MSTINNFLQNGYFEQAKANLGKQFQLSSDNILNYIDFFKKEPSKPCQDYLSYIKHLQQPKQTALSTTTENPESVPLALTETVL